MIKRILRFLTGGACELRSLIDRASPDKDKENMWWRGLVCSGCKTILTQKPNSYCGHCKRTICVE